LKINNPSFVWFPRAGAAIKLSLGIQTFRFGLGVQTFRFGLGVQTFRFGLGVQTFRFGMIFKPNNPNLKVWIPIKMALTPARGNEKF